MHGGISVHTIKLSKSKLIRIIKEAVRKSYKQQINNSPVVIYYKFLHYSEAANFSRRLHCLHNSQKKLEHKENQTKYLEKWPEDLGVMLGF